MKIGMLADMYKPYISGVTNHIEINYNALTKAGHEVTIFTFGGLDYADVDEKVVRSKGLTIKLPFADLDFQLGKNHTKEAIEKIQTMDILNVHHPFMSGGMASRYAKPKHIPVVFTSHTRYDLYAELYTPFLPKKWVRGVIGDNLQKSCRNFDAVITPSNSSRKMYDSLGVEANFVHIPNGISLAHIEATSQGYDRSLLGLKDEDEVIMYLGRIGPEKNLPLMIDAFDALAKIRPNARLVIVGRGTENESMEQQVKRLGIEDLVRFTGFVPYQEVPKYLLMADIFLTASVTEVHPLSALEAMGAGLPIVGVDASGVGDVVDHMETGLLSELDIHQIAENLAYLLDRAELRLAMGKKAKEAVKKYDIENTHRLLLAQYQSLIDEKKDRKH